MSEPACIFEESATFDPEGDFDSFLAGVPAKWVVYLLADADNRPVQLLCVKNLRYSLKRRLGAGEPAAGPSKRVNYRELVRHVHWRRVDSTTEADWLYYEAARELFPQSYQGMTGFRPAWFVHVNPDAKFPRYTKTIDLTIRAGLLIGPVEDKHAAARLIELAEDAFDLCRFYNVLIEAPHGKACAYKEMGKCPGPCDGSISMGQYRRLMQWSVDTLVDPGPFVRDQSRRMQAASEEYRFETAGKIKAFVNSISRLGKGPFRHVRLLKDFAFLSLQHGPREGTAKVFLVSPGRIEHILSLIAEPARPAELLRLALTLAAETSEPAIDVIGAERIGIVAHHLFSAKNVVGGPGVFLPIGSIEERALVKAFRDLKKQVPAETGVEAEGVTKELQALPDTL
jgi:excinuclease UvrABC nuclease subunit